MLYDKSLVGSDARDAFGYAFVKSKSHRKEKMHTQ